MSGIDRGNITMNVNGNMGDSCNSEATRHTTKRSETLQSDHRLPARNQNWTHSSREPLKSGYTDVLLASNIAHFEIFVTFLSPSWRMLGQYIQIGHDRFLVTPVY
jgi:hypothetical protein